MNISRYEPWTVLNQLQRHLNSYLDGDSSSDANASSSATADWIPLQAGEKGRRRTLHSHPLRRRSYKQKHFIKTNLVPRAWRPCLRADDVCLREIMALEQQPGAVRLGAGVR